MKSDFGLKEKLKYALIGAVATAILSFGIDYLNKPDYTYILKQGSDGISHLYINNVPWGGGGDITFNKILKDDYFGLQTIPETLPKSGLTGNTSLSRLEFNIKR